MNTGVSPLEDENWRKNSANGASPALQSEGKTPLPPKEDVKEEKKDSTPPEPPVSQGKEGKKEPESDSSQESSLENKKRKKFHYVAMNEGGNKVDGDLEAESKDEVVGFLHEKKMTVLEVREQFGFNLRDLGSFQIGGVPLGEKVIFMKQFATMASAGLPLVSVLSTLTTQTKNAYFRSQLEKVVDDVENGMRLSKAFSRRSKLLSEIEINLIAAGEDSGNLVEMMQRIASNLEKTKEFRGKVQGALIYPAIIFVAIIGVITLLMLFMVPSIKDIFKDFDAKLPLSTQIMISISDFMVSYWWALLIVAIAAIGGLLWYRSTPSGRTVTDRLLLKIPIFGPLISKIQTAEMSRLLAMLMQSGIPILSCLEITATALTNVNFSETLRKASIEIEKGVPLAVPMSKSEFMPSLLVKMIAAGEETGNLDKVLADVAKFYEAEANEMTNNLTKLLEPFILLIVGGVVAFIALAVYGPVFELANVLGA